MTVTVLAQKLLRPLIPKRFYFEDAILTSHNHSFTEDPKFRKAYERGLKALEGVDYHNQWRVHVALWVANSCSKISGDFVECGVNYGLTSSAIMHYLDWSRVNKQFWLVDSFSGVDEDQLTKMEKEGGSAELSAANKRSGFYNCDVERCRRNFSEWKTAHVVKGWIPDCLSQVKSEKIAYLHLDLNSVTPEIAAFRHFAPRLSPGSFVLLDDYGYSGGGATNVEWKKAASELSLDILSLPTGQGLIHIPATR